MANKDLIIKPKRAKGDDGYRTFSIRIKEEIVSKLDNISTQTGHSRNELIGVFLEYAIENCRIEDRQDIIRLVKIVALITGNLLNYI